MVGFWDLVGTGIAPVSRKTAVKKEISGWHKPETLVNNPCELVTFRTVTTEKKGEDNFHDLLHSLPARNMLSHEIAGIESAEKIVGFANLAFSR